MVGVVGSSPIAPTKIAKKKHLTKPSSAFFTSIRVEYTNAAFCLCNAADLEVRRLFTTIVNDYSNLFSPYKTLTSEPSGIRLLRSIACTLVAPVFLVVAKLFMPFSRAQCDIAIAC